jgi:Ribonuclease G/E
MVTCPACQGSGVHDCRDDDAWMGEHMSDQEIARFRAQGGVHPVGVIVCGVCEGSGLVTVNAAAIIARRSREVVAEIAARLEQEEANR